MDDSKARSVRATAGRIVLDPAAVSSLPTDRSLQRQILDIESVAERGVAGIHHISIVEKPCVIADLLQGSIDSKRLTVRAMRRHRLDDISDRENLRPGQKLSFLQVSRIA